MFHKGTPSDAREAIMSFANTIDVKGPDEVLTPLTEIRPVPVLEVVKDGFQCLYSNCNSYLCGTRMQIEYHCRKSHEWTKKEGIQWRSQAVQTFFKGIYTLT